jgi:hypothetical protein
MSAKTLKQRNDRQFTWTTSSEQQINETVQRMPPPGKRTSPELSQLRRTRTSQGQFSLSQFTVAMFAFTQLGIGWSLIVQFGIYVAQCKG